MDFIQNEMGLPGKSLIYVPVHWELTLKEQRKKQGDQVKGCHSSAGGQMVAWDGMGVVEVIDSGYILRVEPAGIHCWAASTILYRRNTGEVNPTKVSGRSTWKDGPDT